MLKYSNLSTIVQQMIVQVKELLAKQWSQKKLEQVEEQKLDSKAYLLKVKVEHVKEKSTSNIQVE
jgi:hypothetical protein